MSGVNVMLSRISVADWVEVDRTADPGAFVGYLDAVSGHDAVRAYKEQTYALLGLRPGDRVLDVGCGTGDDARALARFVAPGGWVVGVDASETMIEEARRRNRGGGLPIEFRTGDAHSLEIPPETFVGARADRVFQHLDDPEQALTELIRVTKPGGRIVVADTDWGALVVDGPDRETTSAVLAEVAAAIRNPWIGRQLFGMFGKAGLREVTVVAGTAVVNTFAQADKLFHLCEGARRARERGAMTEAAFEDWMHGIAETDRAGRFCCAVTGFIVAGQRV
jgi:ubiquinone/menaquinone biosynthesis C-methylase UbiE